MVDNDLVLADFRKALDITSAARFHANIRLTARQNHSSYVIALLSTFVIMLSLVPNFHELTAQKSQILLASSILVSVFIIFTSLMDSASNYYHRGESLHLCARKISALSYKARLLDPEGASFSDDLAKMRESYKIILEDCSFNHDRVDYINSRLDKPKLFKDHYSDNPWIYAAQRSSDRIRYIFGTYGWLIPHTAVIGGVTYVVVYFIF